MKIKRLTTQVVLLFLLSGICLPIFSGHVAAATGPPGNAADYNFYCGFTIVGRQGCHGYYTNTNFYLYNPNVNYAVSGTDILVNWANTTAPAYNNIASAAAFENELTTYLQQASSGTYDYDGIGAAFTIDAMLGESGSALCGTGTCTWQDGVNYANANLAQWETDVNYYAQKGWITWRVKQVLPTGTTDSTHVCAVGSPTVCGGSAQIRRYDGKDIVFRADGTAASPEMIVFDDPNPGGGYVRIRIDCGNISGPLTPLTAPPSYTLSPTITATVNGVAASIAEPGDTVTFRYAVANNASVNSASTSCMAYNNVFTGYHQAVSPAEKTGGTPSTTQTVCNNQIFNHNATVTIGTYTVPAADVATNKTVCSSLYLTPGSVKNGVAGPPLGVEACIIVGSLPYARVFGGDVSAGNAQSSATCDPNTGDYDAGIASWNQDSGLYSGAGTQYAAYAVGSIQHFASAQANPNTNAGKAPGGLAFANTSTPYGNLGAGSLPCMNDYYNVLPGATYLTTNVATPGTIDLSSLSSGAYVYTGTSTLTLSGMLKSGANPSRIQLFVPNHNVYIANNITYGTGWTTLADIPMFELVVNAANIYIDHNVSEVDGTYVAQNAQASGRGVGGQISTCATAAGPELLDANLYNNCSTSLLINGAFVANDVNLERSSKTLSDSSGDSPSSLTSSAAEQFNYNPSLWLIQPPYSTGVVTYNTIVDLPPVL
jgi:hypothetical protein